MAAGAEALRHCWSVTLPESCRNERLFECAQDWVDINLVSPAQQQWTAIVKCACSRAMSTVVCCWNTWAQTCMHPQTLTQLGNRRHLNSSLQHFKLSFDSDFPLSSLSLTLSSVSHLHGELLHHLYSSVGCSETANQNFYWSQLALSLLFLIPSCFFPIPLKWLPFIKNCISVQAALL